MLQNGARRGATESRQEVAQSRADASVAVQWRAAGHLLRSRCHLDLRLARHQSQAGVADVFFAGGFKVGQVLLKRGFLELGKEGGVGGVVVLADVIDQLTLAHMVFTVGKRTRRT